jgi:hypothetical protein
MNEVVCLPIGLLAEVVQWSHVPTLTPNRWSLPSPAGIRTTILSWFHAVTCPEVIDSFMDVPALIDVLKMYNNKKQQQPQHETTTKTRNNNKKVSNNKVPPSPSPPTEKNESYPAYS